MFDMEVSGLFGYGVIFFEQALIVDPSRIFGAIHLVVGFYSEHYMSQWFCTCNEI